MRSGTAARTAVGAAYVDETDRGPRRDVMAVLVSIEREGKKRANRRGISLMPRGDASGAGDSAMRAMRAD
jgi:hypothetical protein